MQKVGEQLAERIAAGDVTASREALDLLSAIAKRFALSSPTATVRALAGIASGGMAVIHKVKDWDWAIERMVGSNGGACRRAMMSEWDVKLRAMANGIQLRAKDSITSFGQLRVRTYKTTDWKAAIVRMQQKANFGSWNGRSDPWTRWALTVAKNTNRRWEGRYAKGQTRNGQGERTEAAAGEAAIQMRVQRTRPNARNRKR